MTRRQQCAVCGLAPCPRWVTDFWQWHFWSGDRLCPGCYAWARQALAPADRTVR